MDKNKGKVIKTIILAAIILACLAAMAPTVSAQNNLPTTSYSGLYNNITLSLNPPYAVSVLIGQDIWFQGAVGSVIIQGDPANYNVAGELFTSDATGKFDTAVMTKPGIYYVNATVIGTTVTQWFAKLAVTHPTMTLDLKSGGTSVSSIAVGTVLQVDFANNLNWSDMVSLVITDPDGNTLTSKNNQNFSYINVSYLTGQYGAPNGINTTGWKLGTYTFRVQTKQIVAKNIGAQGLDASSNEKTLSIISGEINITADKTSAAELESVTLTVTGRAGNAIQINTSDPAHTIFPGGMNDNPATDTYSGFTKVIDADGMRIFTVKFNTTGSYTITVTDLTAAGQPTDTVDITVSEKAVTFDVPVTVVIGEKFTMKGTANTGTTVDIAVEGKMYPLLNDVVIDANMQFSKEVDTATANIPEFQVPGSVRLKAYLDRPSSGDIQPGEVDDGSVAILMSRGGLTAELSSTYVAQGDDFTISGTARGSKSVDIVIVSPKGSGGTMIDGTAKWELCPGKPPVGIYLASASVSEDNFSKQITVGENVDTGSYLVVVLSKGADNKYGKVGWAFLADALCEYSLTAKTQDQLLAIVNDITALSDDLLVALYIKVEAPHVFDTGQPENPYPSIFGTHNGTITPSRNINVSRLFTYSCSGTGGHSEYAKIWNSSWGGVEAHWGGYTGEWHNITFNEPITLVEGETYNYTIKTGSYPQIHHTNALLTAFGWINCTEFLDANGKRYTNWIPAIRLEE
jgi:hypothetical protein